MKTDNKGQPYVEYEGRRITFVPKGRKEGKDWSDSDVIRIQSHQYDKEGAERPQLCSGAELPIRNHEDLGRIMGLLSKVVAEGYSLASKTICIAIVLFISTWQTDAFAQNGESTSTESKTPLCRTFPQQTPFYKEITTGVSFEWLAAYLKSAAFSEPEYIVQSRKSIAELVEFLTHHGVEKYRIQLRRKGDGEFTRDGKIAIWLEDTSENSYCDQIAMNFKDGERSIKAMFGRTSVDGPLVLISGTIDFSKGDVSEEALIAKYKKSLPDASCETTEITKEEEAEAFLGTPGYKVSMKFKITTFGTEHGCTSVKVGKSGALALTKGDHHIDETGMYSGSAGPTMTRWLASMLPGCQPDSQAYSELENEVNSGEVSKQDVGLATMSFKIWNNLKTTLGIPQVIVKDKVLENASVGANAEATRMAEEEAKRLADEAEKKKAEEEAARANDF